LTLKKRKETLGFGVARRNRDGDAVEEKVGFAIILVKFLDAQYCEVLTVPVWGPSMVRPRCRRRIGDRAVANRLKRNTDIII
jgi:hypothetical protein